MPNYGPKIVTDGLVSCLDAANPKSYPGSGTSWSDLSGFGNNGTISSGEPATENGLTYIRNLNNLSNFFIVSMSNSTSLNAAFTQTSGGWTIEEVIWTNSVVYPEADAGTVVSNQAYGANAVGFDWNHGTLNTSFRFTQSNNSSGTFTDNSSFSVSSPYNNLNSWKIRTMIWNRSNNINSLYINGVFINSVNTPNTAGRVIYDGDGIQFGSLYGWKHYGRRSVIKIYNRVLTPEEIQQNFNALRGRYGI